MDMTERDLVAAKPVTLHDVFRERADDPAEARVELGDGLDVTGPGCAFTCFNCFDGHPCAYEVRGRRTIEGVDVPACITHIERGGTMHAEAAVAHASVLRERHQTREVYDLLGVLECAECEQPIKFDALRRSWWHIEAPDIAHMPRPACICEFGDTTPHPLCRDHGHEDVTSGAYDQLPEVRARVDAMLGSVNR